VSLWLAVARAPDADEMVRTQLRAALAVAAAVNDRFVRSGIAGLEGALEAARQIEAVLTEIDPSRLATLRESVAVLERELRYAAQLLARLRVVKESVDRTAT
jgi:hypothetical protein